MGSQVRTLQRAFSPYLQRKQATGRAENGRMGTKVGTKVGTNPLKALLVFIVSPSAEMLSFANIGANGRRAGCRRGLGGVRLVGLPAEMSKFVNVLEAVLRAVMPARSVWRVPALMLTGSFFMPTQGRHTSGPRVSGLSCSALGGCCLAARYAGGRAGRWRGRRGCCRDGFAGKPLFHSGHFPQAGFIQPRSHAFCAAVKFQPGGAVYLMQDCVIGQVEGFGNFANGGTSGGAADPRHDGKGGKRQAFTGMGGGQSGGVVGGFKGGPRRCLVS